MVWENGAWAAEDEREGAELYVMVWESGARAAEE
jgi:hypothetical protein